MVDFYAPWCGPCKVQIPIMEDLAEEWKGKATLAKVNSDEEIELAAQYGISSIPALLLFKDGKVVDRMVGLTSKKVLESKLMDQVGGAAPSCSC